MKVAIIAILFVSAAFGFTCRNYDGDHCVSVGCDVHCQGIGKRSGYCGYNGNGCTCYCVNYDDTVTETLDEEKLSPKSIQTVSEILGEPCDCTWEGKCYSCGSQLNNGMVCWKGLNCGWRNCTTIQCYEVACMPKSCP